MIFAAPTPITTTLDALEMFSQLLRTTLGLFATLGIRVFQVATAEIRQKKDRSSVPPAVGKWNASCKSNLKDAVPRAIALSNQRLARAYLALKTCLCHLHYVGDRHWQPTSSKGAARAMCQRKV